jgi:GDP-4-dehydro-6-deoxy-D-mannose reductase
MKALITGGGGFAGSHLAEYLLEQGQEVVAMLAPQALVTNLSHILAEIRVEYADIRDAERLFEILRDTRPQRIYHLAALSSPAESFQNPRLTYEVNFGGTLNLLLAWRRQQFDSRFLFVSSSDVYGVVRSESLPLREDTPLRPANPYAASKASGELLAFQFWQSYGLPIVRVRPFNHTGPRQSSNFVCSSLARQVAEIDLNLRPPRMSVGKLEIERDFSDVRDIVRGYTMLLERGEAGEVYQLCSGRAVSIGVILQTLMDSVLAHVDVAVDPSLVRSDETPMLWGDASKANRTVAWEARYSLEKTLRDLKLYWHSAVRSGAEARQ